MTERQDIGQQGERSVVAWLRNNGYIICEMNWRCGHDEIDIIAKRYDQIHFIEVKTRRAGSLVTPEQSINERKLRAVRRCASAYMAMRRIPLEPYFDLAAVDVYSNGEFDVRLIEHALEYGW